jgi:hypothetical protein
MTIILLEGISTLETSEHEIELLPMIQLMRQPFIADGDAELVYKHGGDFYRKLLENTPLKNDKKYVTVTALVQYLTPITASIPNNDWHCDPGVVNPYNQDARLHILMNDISARTEFLDKDIEMAVDESYVELGHRDFRLLVTDAVNNSDAKGIKATPNKMTTFTNRHPHRAILSTRDEFRFFWRVQESDIEAPKENAITTVSNVTRLTDRKSIPSIEQHEYWVIVRDKVESY